MEHYGKRKIREVIEIELERNNLNNLNRELHNFMRNNNNSNPNIKGGLNNNNNPSLMNIKTLTIFITFGLLLLFKEKR
jgi:hypothetical protein